MHKLLLLALMLVLFGCAGSDAEAKSDAQDTAPNIVGRWLPAPEFIAEVPEGPARDAAAKMATTFKAGGQLLSVNNKGETSEGTYLVQSIEGDQVTVEMTMDGAITEMTFTISGDEMTVLWGPEELKLLRE